jgi:hypothetical protein
MGKNQDPGSGINIRDPPHCENHLIVLRGPLYFNGSMKQYGRVYGGGGHLQLLVKQVGGGERMGVDPNQ